MEEWRKDAAEIRRQAQRLAHDEWQAFIVREAAKAAGIWLEQKVNLGRPIATLTLRDLEGLTNAAMARWIVLASHRLKECPTASDEYAWIMQA